MNAAARSRSILVEEVLISTVTWTLTAADGGTRVRMAHEGFGPHNNYAYDAMSGGWGRMLKHIDRLITEGK